MTNQQGAPEALRLADLLILSGALPGSVSECAGIELRRLHAENERLAALVEAQQPATHVQNPAEIEHVAGDVSKNGAESNMNAQQPAPATQQAQQQEAQEPVAVVVPCYTPSGKRVALYSAKQDLPIGTKLYTAPQPSPTAQAASSAVLKAIRKANMQLVRTGDNAFMLVPYKVATAQAAELATYRASLPLPAAGQEPVARVLLDCSGKPMVNPELLAAKELADPEAFDMMYPHRAPHRVAMLYPDAAPQPAVAAGWVSVDERLPEPNVEVLCAGRGFGNAFVTACYYDDERREWYPVNTHWTDATGCAQYPTHWMPLPPAPSTEGESNG